MPLLPVKCEIHPAPVRIDPAAVDFGFKVFVAFFNEDRTATPGLGVGDAQGYQQHFPGVVENASGLNAY